MKILKIILIAISLPIFALGIWHAADPDGIQGLADWLEAEIETSEPSTNTSANEPTEAAVTQPVPILETKGELPPEVIEEINKIDMSGLEALANEPAEE